MEKNTKMGITLIVNLSKHKRKKMQISREMKDAKLMI